MLVKTPSTAEGNTAASSMTGSIETAQSTRPRRTRPGTSSSLPSPIRFAATAPHVEPKAWMKRKSVEQICRTMFETARGSSPRCSTARKKRSHAKNAKASCTISQRPSLKSERCRAPSQEKLPKSAYFP